MFATFNIFWSALVLPLSAPPYSLSLTAIGAFGLAGVVGALAAARAGHWADQGFAQRTSLGALVIDRRHAGQGGRSAQGFRGTGADLGLLA